MSCVEHESIPTDYVAVDSKVFCMLTRIKLKSTRSMWTMYQMYRKIRASAEDIDGLIVSLFLVAGPRTFFTLSIWKDVDAIYEFNGLREHVDAANMSFGLVNWLPDGPEIWSAQFRLSATSPNNLRWSGVNPSPFMTGSNISAP